MSDLLIVGFIIVTSLVSVRTCFNINSAAARYSAVYVKSDVSFIILAISQLYRITDFIDMLMKDCH